MQFLINLLSVRMSRWLSVFRASLRRVVAALMPSLSSTVLIHRGDWLWFLKMPKANSCCREISRVQGIISLEQEILGLFTTTRGRSQAAAKAGERSTFKKEICDLICAVIHLRVDFHSLLSFLFYGDDCWATKKGEAKVNATEMLAKMDVLSFMEGWNYQLLHQRKPTSAPLVEMIKKCCLNLKIVFICA